MKKSIVFSKVRVQHKNEIAEDYTELINQLIDNHGEARVSSIARELGISHVTVIKTLKRLKLENYINYSKGSLITLTPLGIKLAKISAERHKIVFDFLKAIGVPNRQAEIDTEGIEHHISDVTLRKFKKYLSSLKKSSS